jgi:hypothetical protein
VIDVFILGYNGADYFTKWHSEVEFSDDIKFHFVDNGDQNLKEYLSDMLIHKTKSNIFCSGGWNLICDIGFDYMKLDKIIIGQEDAKFDDDTIKEIYEKTNEKTICGAYDNSFEFSLFGLHRNVFDIVGRFDENFLIAGDEDNDFKHRCKTIGVSVTSLNVTSANNSSITGEIRKPYTKRNGAYLHKKWGITSPTENRIYEYVLPYNGEHKLIMMPDYRTHFDLSDDVEMYMSEVEYDRFKQLRNNNE